jgi:hypothetical protein
MPCSITAGFQLGCRDNTGGIKNIYILSGSITSISGSQGLITSISGSGSFYQFQLFRQTSNFSEEIVATPENGTIVYNQTCNAVFFKMQTATRNQVRVLAQNPNLAIIVETNNGSETGAARWFLMGQVNGSQLLSGTSATGTAFSDLNGYNLVFSGNEANPASEVSGSATSFTGSLSGITITSYSSNPA